MLIRPEKTNKQTKTKRWWKLSLEIFQIQLDRGNLL